MITICIPNDKKLPDVIKEFSLEENYMMLKIGSECLIEGRKVVAEMSQNEIYNKIKEEMNEEIIKLEINLKQEREKSNIRIENIEEIYEKQINKLNQQIELLKDELKYSDKVMKLEMMNEIEKVKDKYELMYKEKEKQVERMTEVHEKMIVQYQSTKSTSHKGSEGEKRFEDYAEVFIDFKGYEIIDKHTQGGQGDFHLHFEEFDVLVDAKNYKKKVPNDQRDKIKKDLQKNEHLQFGWLVSLNTSIEKYDKAPLMYEWINSNQCLVYINNLSGFEDPKKILRIVWFTCKVLHNMISDINIDHEELVRLKNNNYKFMDKMRNLRKTIREVNTSMNVTRNLVQLMDDELRGILEDETNEIVMSNISLFDDWWVSNIEIVSEDIVSSSTDLWTRFKQDNKSLLNEMNITGEKFKQFLKSKVPMTSILLRNKNANSAFDIKGIQLREINYISNIIEEKIDVELNEEGLKKNVVKKIVKKNPEIYFSKELDSKILNDYYLNNDIMEISEKYDVRPWQIVSLLMRYKIIKKRGEALGYDKYKETDEYKQKMEKK
jgi:hypothetical protein